MSLLGHLSYLVVLDFLIFQYWYRIANRYTVLNFHETGYLPARYIISGLVAGAFIYWAYLLPVLLLKRLHPRYHHPRWWLLWSATAFISSVQVWMIVRGGTPPLSIEVTLALLLHLQLMHFITLMIAQRVTQRELGSIFPGVRSALILMGLWLFWIGYSFAVPAQGDPQPLLGSSFERYMLVLFLTGLIGVGLAFRLGIQMEVIHPSDLVIPSLNITVADILDSFYAAWALFYMVIPVVQYLVRGYVMAHSNLFPTFLLGMLLPFGWSVLVMWPIIFISKPPLALRLVGQAWRQGSAWVRQRLAV
jgi:hypothetical protein